MTKILSLLALLGSSLLLASNIENFPAVTTKGDLYGYSTAPARLAVGTDAQCLVADSTQTLGIKWANCGGVTGSGTANQVAYWSSSSALTSGAGLTYDGTTFGTLLALELNEANTAAGAPVIYNKAATGSTTLSGGSGATNGGNIVAYGGSHATKANTVEVRHGSTVDATISSGNILSGGTFTALAAASAQYNFSGVTTTGVGYSGGAVRGYISGTEIFQFYNAGLQISANMVLFVQDGTAANPGWTFASDPDTGFYRVSTNTINITTGGTSRAAISTALFQTTLPFQTTDATDSSSTSTGSGIFAGGVSVAKTLYVGTGANITGLLTLAGSSITTGNEVTATGTLSSAGAGDTTGISALYSTTGGSSRNIYGADIELAAGSTTAAGAIAGQFFSAVASVPTTLGGANFNACTSNGTGCTVGYRGFARGAGSKTLNIGGYNEATSGATNVAVIGHAPGVADTASFKGIGVVGAVQYPSATPTNFKGVAVWAVLNTTTANYSVASTFPAVNAAIVADNGDTTADVVNFMDGGTTVFKVADGGLTTIGTGTATIHRINAALQTASSGTLTLLNGPGAATGNPSVYLTLNINGTNYVIPAWAY